MTTYNVSVFTGDKFGAGTDANVYIVLFGEIDDTGMQIQFHLLYSVPEEILRAAYSFII